MSEEGLVDQLPRKRIRKQALKRQTVLELRVAVRGVQEQIQDLAVATRIVDEQAQNLAAATRRLNAILANAIPWADDLVIPPPKLPEPHQSPAIGISQREGPRPAQGAGGWARGRRRRAFDTTAGELQAAAGIRHSVPRGPVVRRQATFALRSAPKRMSQNRAFGCRASLISATTVGVIVC